MLVQRVGRKARLRLSQTDSHIGRIIITCIHKTAVDISFQIALLLRGFSKVALRSQFQRRKSFHDKNHRQMCIQWHAFMRLKESPASAH